jgi:lysophospholipase L1-like esterase
MAKDLKNITFTMTLAVIVVIAFGCQSSCLTCSQVMSRMETLNHSAIRPISRINPEKATWWQERMQLVNERVKQGDVDLLFIGDSITHGWEKYPELWTKYFGSWKALNAGFGGDQTQHVLWRLEHGNIDGINPRLAVIMIGTNNSNGEDNTPKEIAEGVEAIICMLRYKLPKTKIVVLAIFPRGSKEQRTDKTINATYNLQWAKNDRANEIYSELANDKTIYYLDINQSFLNDNGILTREIMPDLLHLSEEGYHIWGQEMLPVLEKLMID